ncbi:hypothetical protein Hdeb2414_s0012g00386871 [Helianthus debilis subsp. tardiflorus]
MTVCGSDEERPREERDGGNLRRSETRTAGQFVYLADFPLVLWVSRVRSGWCCYPISSPVNPPCFFCLVSFMKICYR